MHRDFFFPDLQQIIHWKGLLLNCPESCGASQTLLQMASCYGWTEWLWKTSQQMKAVMFGFYCFGFFSPCSSQGGKVLGWEQSAARPPATTCLAFAVSIKPRVVCKTQSLLAGRSWGRRNFCYEVNVFRSQQFVIAKYSPKLNQKFFHFKWSFGIDVSLIRYDPFWIKWTIFFSNIFVNGDFIVFYLLDKEMKGMKA